MNALLNLFYVNLPHAVGYGKNEVNCGSVESLKVASREKLS